MYYKQKEQTWKDNWNNMVRYVIFKDEKLLDLMCLPKNTSIMQFIEKHFVQIESGSQVLTDESVRILYHDSEGFSTRNKNVLLRHKEFDIYVRDDVLHTADKDRLKNRYDLISERLKYLLINNAQKYGLRFRFDNSFNLWTKTQGYRRYHVVFSYNTTV